MKKAASKILCRGKYMVNLIFAICFTFSSNFSYSQPSVLDSLLPVRGFCISAPHPEGVDSFTHFIKEELAPRKVNVLVLMVDYHYEFQSHPELREPGSLSRENAKQIVQACRESNIRIIPQINLLGHQSWAGHLNSLLRVYPEFDETPLVKMPENYKWPNADSLYCKSYCPLHPGVHKVLFDVIDELVDVFEADAFHAGMDEVFYIGMDQCVRCRGKNKASLFAGEVNRIRDHLASKNKELWIWGDRLLDGKTSGMGMWEASYNNTYPAVDSISGDVVICDWHYERPDKTAVYLALKGFRVITCPWRDAEIALMQLRDMIDFRKTATPEMKDRYQGMMQTVWSGSENFLRGYYKALAGDPGNAQSPWNCFLKLFTVIKSYPANP